MNRMDLDMLGLWRRGWNTYEISQVMMMTEAEADRRLAAIRNRARRLKARINKQRAAS